MQSDNQAINTMYPQPQGLQQSACPNCGYCPHCGRGGHQALPYYPTYPVYPMVPNYPWNPLHPTIIYTTSTSGGLT